MKTRKTYSVGQIAKLCSISAKQLRYLDEKGIIIPAFRDENNNYRYYSEKQIEEILLVKEMKQLGLPLERISHLLCNRDIETLRKELNIWLDNAREEVNSAMIKYDKTLELMMRFIDVKDFLSVDTAEIDGLTPNKAFRLKEVEARALVATRYSGIYMATQLFIKRRAELYGIIEKYGLETTGPNMAIFHNGYQNQFNSELEKCLTDLEVCMAVKKIKVECPYCRMQKKFRAVTGIHIGHYRHMHTTYVAMEAWGKDHNLNLNGASIEEYIIGATHTSNETNYITRIFLPLAGYTID